MTRREKDALLEQVAGVTECPICSEKLNNNRLLPCGHTFCLKCLELYKKQANPKGKSLPCPICRREFGIPKGGCSSLTKNFALEQLIGAQKPVKDNDMAQCDVCDHGRMMAAILFCLQCEQNLCVDCERTHKKMKSTSMHHVVPISKKNQMRHSMSKNYCEHHVDQGLELVCSDCKEAICWKCKSLTHQSHNCVEINEAADQCVEQLKLDFEETENRISMLGKISENIKDKARQQQDHLDQAKSNIAKISADMIRTIVANEEKLVKQLEADCTRNMEAFQPQEDRVCKQLDDLKQHKISTKQILDCGLPWKIYHSTNDLHDKTIDLLKFNNIDADDISFSNLSDIQIREQLIGIKPIVQAENNPCNQGHRISNTLLGNKSKPSPQTPQTKPKAASALTAVGGVSSTSAEPSVTSTDVKNEAKKKHPPQTPLKQATSALVAGILCRSSLEAEPAVKTECNKKWGATFPGGQKSEKQSMVLRMSNRGTILFNKEEVPVCRVSSDGVEYVNSLQSMQQTCVEVTTLNEKSVETSTPVNSDDGAYVNYCPQSEQQPCVEPTVQKKKPEGNSLPGTTKRKPDSDWSNTSIAGKITGNDKSINGVSILKQKVYAIYENSPHIQVYDSITLNWLSQLKLKDLNEPKHLTSCGLNNCLYLTGLKDQTVYKAEGTGNAVLLKWKSEGDAHSLSTTKDGTVILAGFITQTLKEYTALGILLRTIILKPDLGMAINPWHALKLESGNYLITHGQSRTSKHRVCMISPHGDVLKFFGDEKGSEMNGLFGPYHLALDEKGNVLVADCNNHRIVVLSPILQFVTEFKTDLRHPTRLCFDSATGSLYVADNEIRTSKRKDGQIVVLQPKR